MSDMSNGSSTFLKRNFGQIYKIFGVIDDDDDEMKLMKKLKFMKKLHLLKKMNLMMNLNLNLMTKLMTYQKSLMMMVNLRPYPVVGTNHKVCFL
jgi:hypothetical protein